MHMLVVLCIAIHKFVCSLYSDCEYLSEYTLSIHIFIKENFLCKYVVHGDLVICFLSEIPITFQLYIQGVTDSFERNSLNLGTSFYYFFLRIYNFGPLSLFLPLLPTKFEICKDQFCFARILSTVFGERLLNCYETGRSWPHRQRSMRLKRANLGWSNVVTFFPLSIIAMKFRLKVRIGTENNVISLISNPHIKWDFSIFSSVVSLCSSLMAQNMCTLSNMKG